MQFRLILVRKWLRSHNDDIPYNVNNLSNSFVPNDLANCEWYSNNSTQFHAVGCYCCTFKTNQTAANRSQKFCLLFQFYTITLLLHSGRLTYNSIINIYIYIYLSSATTCPCGLRGPPSWAWQQCNRLLRLGRPWGAVTLSRWCEWWYRRM